MSFLLGMTLLPAAGTGAQQHTKPITWEDLRPLHARLEAQGISSTAFASYLTGVRKANARRVREGDLDHLVFYLLQSTRFTTLAPIEPALSAKTFVDSLDARQREEFLTTSRAPRSRIPAPVVSRLAALIRALDRTGGDARLQYFRGLVKTTFPVRSRRESGLIGEYLRAMRFLYEKEFVAQRSQSGTAAVAELYRTRGLSTDTAVEAGYLVYLGLGVMKSLDPTRRVRRALVVGPGLDLAPRTALLEVGPPESYQPWAVIDALLALGLSVADDLEVVAADINPRVVDHLRRSRTEPPTLILVSGIAETEDVRLTQEYRDYFAGLGRAVGEVTQGAASSSALKGHLEKSVRVSPAAARTLRAERLDIVTERLDGPAFDVIVATNILPYFDDRELMLAITNVARMLAPGGVFLHNEARPFLHDVMAALGLPAEQSRQAIIAEVRRAPAPLADSIWLHRRAAF